MSSVVDDHVRDRSVRMKNMAQHLSVHSSDALHNRLILNSKFGRTLHFYFSSQIGGDFMRRMEETSTEDSDSLMSGRPHVVIDKLGPFCWGRWLKGDFGCCQQDDNDASNAESRWLVGEFGCCQPERQIAENTKMVSLTKYGPEGLEPTTVRRGADFARYMYTHMHASTPSTLTHARANTHTHILSHTQLTHAYTNKDTNARAHTHTHSLTRSLHTRTQTKTQTRAQTHTHTLTHTQWPLTYNGAHQHGLSDAGCCSPQLPKNG